MASLPEDPEEFQPSSEDWAEYAEWSRAEDNRSEPPQDRYCSAHDVDYHTKECPACKLEWDQTGALGDEPAETDGWYLDLLMRASCLGHDPYNPERGS